jgi:CRISPR-associated protein Csx10
VLESQLDVGQGKCFVMQLTSAYVGRHPETGQLDPEALPLELVEALGGQVEVERRFWGFEVLGGFNRKWRLEVPQALAVAGGAVLLLRAKAAIPAETLRQVEHEGLGERRNEGFGRVIFLAAPIREGFEWDKIPSQPSAEAAAAPLGDEWKWLEERLVVGVIQAELVRAAMSKLRFEGEVSGSLLNRLRGLLRGQAKPDSALAALDGWVREGGQLKETAIKQLKRAALAQVSQKKTLLAWLQEAAKVQSWEGLVALCGGHDELRRRLREKRLTTAAQAQAVVEARAAALTVFLIEAVLAEKAKSNRRRES